MKPSSRDYKTGPVLKRLVYLDHVTLILARCLQARGHHTEGFQNVDVHDGDDGDNRGPILDVSTSQAEPDDTADMPVLWTDSAPPPREGRQESKAAPAFGGNVENVNLRKPRYQEGDDEDDDGVNPTIK